MPSIKSEQLATRLFHLVQKDDFNELSAFFSSLDNQTLKTLQEVINQLDNTNQESSLHLSSSKLSHEVIKCLLEHGADPNLKNGSGQTPSLLVIRRLKECSCEICTRDAIRCINIFGDHHADFSLEENTGDTALYLAAQYQLAKCATALLRNGAPIDSKRRRHDLLSKHKSMLTVLSEKLPSIVLNVFDRAVTIQGSKNIHDPDCEIVFDLSVILPTEAMESYQSQAKNPTAGSRVHPLGNGENKIDSISNTESNPQEEYRPRREMGFLNDLLESKNTDSKTYRAILRHPLVNVFTDVKWKSLEVMFIAFICMQIGVLIAYTTFLFITIFVDCPYEVYQAIRYRAETIGTQNVNVKIGHRLPTAEQLCEIQLASKVISGYVVICVTGVLIKEVQHLIMDFKEYVTDLLNFVQLLGLGSILLTTVIAWDPYSPIYSWLYPVASFGIGISWCQLFVQIGRFPQCAIYVDMFAKTSVNFCWSLSIYSFILIGFAMSYCVLFPSKPNIVDIPLALIRVLSMMAGELDYQGLFVSEERVSENTTTDDGKHRFSVPYPISAHVWYTAFVIMITLVLMNLLVGLAVSDIQGCRKDAEIVVMKRRIRYTCYLEKSFYLITHFVPKFLKDFLRKKITLIKPSNESTLSGLSFSKLRIEDCRLIIRPNDPKDKILSEESKHSIKYWLSHQHTPRHVCKFNTKSKKDFHDIETRPEFSKNDSGDTILSEMALRTPLLSSNEVSMRRMERRLAELDHKLDILIDQHRSRSKSPD